VDDAAAFVEIPTEDGAVRQPVADAGVVAQIARRLRSRVPREVVGRGDDEEACLAHDLHGDHVALDLLAEADAGVEPFAHDVARHADHRDVELDAGMGMHEACEHRRDHQICDRRLHGEPQQAGRLVRVAGGLRGRCRELAERRAHAREQPRACLGQRDAAGGAVEQARAEALLERARLWLSVERPMPRRVAALAKLFCSAIAAKADSSANCVPRIVRPTRTSCSDHARLSDGDGARYGRVDRRVAPFRRQMPEGRMDRRNLLAAAGFGCTLVAGAAFGQQPAASARAPFVGTWMLVSIKYVMPDGRKIEPFGPGAQGLLYFDARGRFATQVMAANRRPFVSNNRMTGTSEENRMMSQGVVAYFGTYTVHTATHILTLHIAQSSFPNWNGTDQLRKFEFVGDELRYTAASSTANPAERAELVWKRAP
jgi:hypothetical protein